MALAIGHSHLNSVHNAAAGLDLDLRFFSLWLLGPPILHDMARPRVHPDIVERLEPLVLSLIGGAAHDLIGLLQHPTPFDFVLPDRPDLPMLDGATVLPYSAVVAAVDALIGPDEADLAGMIAATGVRVLQIESPPPCASHEQLMREAIIIAALWKRSSVYSQTPSPPWLRYKLWRVHSAIVRDRCEARGVEFFPTPPDAMTPEGFLKPELYHDPCHANEAYGRVLLETLGLIP